MIQVGGFSVRWQSPSRVSLLRSKGVMKGVVNLVGPGIPAHQAYLLTCGLTGCALAGTLLIEPYLEGTVLPLFFMAVALSSMLWGARPGILATALGFVLLRVFFIAPALHPLVWNASGAARLALYLGLSSVLVWMGGRQLAANRALHELATRDALTGLHSRRFLLEALELQIAAAVRTGTSVALLLIDVDHFKSVNDNHGHDEGDRILQQVATVIRSRARRSDLVARIGGEEFVVSFAGAGADDALAVAEQFRKTVEAATSQTISIGVALLQNTEHATPAELSTALMRDADTALYRAKRSGRNQVALGA